MKNRFRAWDGGSAAELFEDNSYSFKIIGNVHANPELLEEQDS